MNFRRVRTSLALEEAAGISPREDLRCPWRALRLRLGCRHRESTSVACRETCRGGGSPSWTQSGHHVSPLPCFPGPQDDCTVLSAGQEPTSPQGSVTGVLLLTITIGAPARPFTLTHLTDGTTELSPSYLLSICLSPY